MPLSSKYTRDFVFQWEINDILPEGSRDPELLALCRKIDTSFKEICYPLSECIAQALFAERLQVFHEGKLISNFGLNFTKHPRPEYEIWMKTSVWADVQFDPAEILSMPSDEMAIGASLLALTLEGIEKLEKFDGFPSDVVRGACHSFSKGNFATKTATRTVKIDGTALRAKIEVIVDARHTRRHLTVSYRGEDLLSTVLSTHIGVDWTLAHDFHSIALEGKEIVLRTLSDEEHDWWQEVMDGTHPLQDPVRVTLDDFPDARAFIVGKGWITP